MESRRMAENFTNGLPWSGNGVFCWNRRLVYTRLLACSIKLKPLILPLVPDVKTALGPVGFEAFQDLGFYVGIDLHLGEFGQGIKGGVPKNGVLRDLELIS